MLFDIIAAAALASSQGAADQTPIASFDETIPGWSVIRRPDGCFAFTDPGPGATSINLYYKTDVTAPALILLFSNSSWRVRDGNATGHRIEFVGSDGNWTNLSAYNFQDTDGSGTIGIISVSFREDAIVAMLTDVTGASSLNFYRDTSLLGRVALTNSPRAVQRLQDCARQQAYGRAIPTIPAPAAR